MDGSSDSGIGIQILLIVILTLINAFFAAAEMAIVSVNKNKIRNLSNEGNSKAKMLENLLEEPSNFLSTIQIGITLAGFFASAYASTGIADDISRLLQQFNIPYVEQISIIVVTILLSYLTLVFGELFPKRIALQKSEEIAMISIKPIILVSKLTTPFVKLLSASTNLLLRAFKMDINDLEEQISREEIKSMIGLGQEHGVINETEKEMLENIFEFDEKVAKEIMTTRQEVFLVELNEAIDEILERFEEERFSRVPVYEDTIDNIIGILNIKDIFTQIYKNNCSNVDIKSILRKPYFVPESKSIDDLFKELQKTKNHMAILIDEYGGFSGIVTIEDLIEEVVGNIFDEFDDDEPEIKSISTSEYIIDGLVSIEEINDYFNLDLKSQYSDTIGGFIIDQIGTIPSDESHFTLKYENLDFELMKIRDKRIDKIKLRLQRT